MYKNYYVIKFAFRKRSEYICKSIRIRNNWGNSDIIDESILQEEGVNVLIPTDRYKNIYTHRYYFWFK